MFGRDRVERRSGKSGFTVSLVTASATFGLFLLVALISVWVVYFGPGPSARQGDKTVVTLASGSSVSAIGAQLKAAGVIRSVDLFRAAASLTGADRKLRAGEYEVPSGASLAAVLNLMVEGRVVRHFVTLPEGWSSLQAVDILNNQPVLTGTVDQTPEEGSLWPDTYEVVRGETRQSVIERMQRAASENLRQLWAQRGPGTVARSPEEAVILASIVEKETGLAAERPRVAAVFSNRLRAGMRLESDPTIVYGVTKGRPLGRGIRRSELLGQTPWNTYQINGLPPTPIANPGKEALKAVLNPPADPALFFVADGSGGHAFAATYEQHQQNVARWRAIERQKAGLPPEAPVPATPDASAAPMTNPADQPVSGAQAVITLPPGASQGAR
ncbi:MAG: endolytic transglycosylase MltG [Brevundimonas sp.]|uniref:endolytic transglycosylase MltG n=1 Tax=Brevundimonas sp. TaxID=1871086 RepID=UPI000DB3BB6F|nr:endolytic transglycosylase MltG [Brevundimonas sp.]PZU73433.1 MAG: endolytic transglycosylase MltG [Brevundimonas sp.]